MERLLSLPQVRQCVGELGVSTLYRLIQLGTFPPPVRLGVGARVAWRESDIQAWIAERIAAAAVADDVAPAPTPAPDARGTRAKPAPGRD